MTVVYASAFMLVAAPVSAGCIDFGIEVFANSMVAIRLCIGSHANLRSERGLASTFATVPKITARRR